MSTRLTAIVVQPEGLRIPGWVVDLATFREWALSESFPDNGRIDWIAGDLEVDMSSEKLNTHGAVKAAVAHRLAELVGDKGLGAVYVDCTRISAPQADLSVEPDVVVALFESVHQGRVRLVPSADGGDAIEIEGAPDLVVECVSKASERKDQVKLREQYWKAGVREYWLADARVDPPRLVIMSPGQTGYDDVHAESDGFTGSAVLGVAVRLLRLTPRAGLVWYRLDARPLKQLGG